MASIYFYIQQHVQADWNSVILRMHRNTQPATGALITLQIWIESQQVALC